MNQDNGLFSVDRLVEFGLGMAMAQQMVQMFNQSVAPMMGSAFGAQSSAAAAQQWQTPVCYVGIEGKPVGPLHEYEVVQFYQNGKITKDSLTWMPGMSNWQRIEETPAILKIIAMVPPVLPNK